MFFIILILLLNLSISVKRYHVHCIIQRKMTPPCPGRCTISPICPRGRETFLIFPISPNFTMLQSKLELLHHMALCVKKSTSSRSIRIKSKTFGPVAHSNSRCSMNPSPDKRVQPLPFLKTKSFPFPLCIAGGFIAIEGVVVCVPPSQYFNLFVRFEGLTSVK